MEKIKRIIERKRSATFTQIFEYTTYAVIFKEVNEELMTDFGKLCTHLQEAFRKGLPDRDKSPSGMPELLGVEIKHHIRHDYSKFISQVPYKGAGNKQHMIVQEHFMKNHPQCLAMEIPVWDDEASGCIDILLIEKNPFCVHVFDFKPNAVKEKKASSQVFRYCKMLIERTGIPAECVRGWYGDEIDTFEVILTNNKKNAKKRTTT